MVVYDDLQYRGLGVYRDEKGFCYGSDSILLANAVKAGPGKRVLELCAGNAVISILAAKKTGARFTAVELQERLCDLGRLSVARNGQQEEIEILCADLREVQNILGYERFDVVCCNPPYYIGGTLGKDAASTHQETCTIFDVTLSAKRMLKNGGSFYMTYPAAQFAEACYALIECGIMPKRVTPVCGKSGAAPYLMLLQCKKGASCGLVWEPPVILGEKDG